MFHSTRICCRSDLVSVGKTEITLSGLMNAFASCLSLRPREEVVQKRGDCLYGVAIRATGSELTDPVRRSPKCMDHCLNVSYFTTNTIEIVWVNEPLAVAP